jgi:YHS domain-containing protein
MELTVLEGNATHLRAGYSCPCGCTPALEYMRGSDVVEEGCCCGNEFAVGPRASASLQPKVGFRPELETFDAPWGERLEAAWSVGPSVHGPSGDDHEHHHDHGDQHGDGSASRAIDPVCGMTVDRAAAEAKGLHTSYEGVDYYFCGKGCKLEFGDDPERFLDPSHVPSM